jgi:hypothetical protein
LVGCGCIGLAPYAVLVAAIERFGWRPAVQKGDNVDQRRAA